ncbi:hypothetical protein AB0L06_23560 [Spirillospora sp. NPDC052269]
MTANKNFKRRVRARARRTGESYTAALRHLRHEDAEERPMQHTWRRVAKPEFGYALQIPDGWDERPPNLRNSPIETARFVDPTDRRHSVIVFRAMPQPGATALDAAERVRPVLAASGFDDFQITPAEVAGRPGARLDCAKHDAGRTWTVREYFVVEGETPFALGCGTFTPEADDPLFTTLATHFELLPPPA